ncbi:MAG: hypothetical protein QOJ16_3371, partial [Acidobacteriota bacterium]|nr:hypothetical protein [Acidobacteriota bacterium]
RPALAEIVAGLWAEVLGRERIGPGEDFFALGGHSLLAARVAARLQRLFGLEVPLRRLLEHSTAESLAAWLEEARGALRPAGSPRAPVPAPVPTSREGELPLSFAQQRLWFLAQLDPASAAYNVAELVHLEGPFDRAAFAAALSAVVRRHEILRTVYAAPEGLPVQVVGPALPVALPAIDLAGLSPARRQAEAGRAVGELAAWPFDLARGPVLRAGLVRLAAAEHRAAVTIHHIACDGWSLGVIASELEALYGAAIAGQPGPLAEPALQYADYAAWQRRAWSGERLAAELGFWRRALAGVPTLLELPGDRPRSPRPSPRGAVFEATWPRDLVERLRGAARAQGATLFMALCAGFEALLARYTGAAAFALGLPIAGRQRVETEGLVGCFVNTLALPAELRGEPSFGELLQRVREAVLDAEAHQELPFERLVEELQPERSLGYAPLVQVALTLQNAPGAPLALAGLRSTRLAVAPAAAKFDLAVSCREAGDLSLGFEYNAERFSAAWIERLARHFRQLVEAALARPEVPCSLLPLLAAAERSELLAWGSGPPAARPPLVPMALAARLTAGAAAAARPALRHAGGELSYGELQARAGAVAARLAALGVGPETRVGLCAERSPEWVIGALAALLAGGAYVPLDPGYPPARLAYLLADSGAVALLATAATLPLLADFEGPVVRLDEPQEAAPPLPRPLPTPPTLPAINAEDLAYVVYTSGSTGLPKGVAVSHGALANLVGWHLGVYALSEGDRCPLIAALGFDAAVWELWPALVAGACLLLPGEAERTAPDRLIAWLRESGATVAFLPTPLAEAALAEDWPAGLSLRALLTGGDRLRRGPWPGLPFAVVNHYGPTENAVVATWGAVPAGAESPAIGRPIAGVTAALLDDHLELTPAGVPGELCLGGSSLARGYLGHPEWTAERFVPDPLSGASGARLYRTGDLAGWRSGGELEFLGRRDEQVKVRGFRIELGEVEAALVSCPGVRAAAAAVHGEGAAARLVAYVVPAAGGEALVPAVAGRLAELLPAFLVPSVILTLPELPLSAHGKIDRRALPPPALAPSAGDGAARTELEALLAGIFAAVLGVPAVGRGDDFFALGGHSLLATQVLARARRACGVELPLAALFETPTVAGLAARLERSLEAGGAAGVGGAAAVAIPPLPEGAPVP